MKKIISFVLVSIIVSHDVCIGQGLSDLQYDTSNSQTSQVTIDIINQVYAQTQADFNFEITSFTQTLTKIIAQLGVYSDQSAEKFNQVCQQELDRSTKQIHTISQAATRQYYDELTKKGLSSGVGVVDPVAKQLEQDINSIENDMINELRATVVILQSKDPLPALGTEIKTGVDLYQQMAAQESAKKQAQASQAKKTTWWKDLKLAGKDFLGEVQVNLEKECKIALTNAVSDTINQLGQEAVNQIVTYGGNMLTSVFEFGTDLIGKQLTETFEKYTSDELNRMFKEFPDYLRTQAFKITGIDPNEEVMVAGLKAVIRQKYPTQSFSGLQVRQSTDVSSLEREYLNNRMPKVAKALQDNFGITKPLNIGLCSSGGGNRAMLVTLGFYLGAQDIGLFDSLLYSAGVSGSTWTIAPWSYLNATQGMSLTDFKNNVVHGVLSTSMMSAGGTSLPPSLNSDQQAIVATNSAKHFAYDQTVSSIDLYGGFIGNFTLLPVGDDRLNVTWSSIAQIVTKGNMPMPMGAAVSYKKGQATTQGLTEYYWYEVNPFEVGSSEVGAYVPTWAFGSKFDKGKPVDGYQGQAPEYPLSYYEGVFGSAFAASVNEVVDQKMTNPSFTMLGQKVTVPVGTWIKNSISEDNRDSRYYPATFHNYTAGLSSSPTAQLENIRLYDGAMSINFPLPLLMRQARDLDVIVVCDAAVDLTSLKSAQVYSQRNGLKFPDMSLYTEEILGSKPLTVLNNPLSKDYDKDMITILYCPFVKNNGFSTTFDPEVCKATGVCKTFNFKYSDAQAEQVVDLARYNVNQIKGEIQAVLQALQALRV